MSEVRLLLLLFTFSVACAAPAKKLAPAPTRPAKPEAARWVFQGEWLGSCKDEDWITFQHLWWLLQRHGIELQEGEGSHGMAEMHVDRELGKATRLVRQDRERFGYELLLHDDPKDRSWLRELRWDELVLSRTYQDVIHRDPRFSAKTQLGAVLRKHLRLARTFPQVKVVRSRRREYLDAHARRRVGFDYEIEFATKSGRTTETTGQVWEEGRRVTSTYLDELNGW